MSISAGIQRHVMDCHLESALAILEKAIGVGGVPIRCRASAMRGGKPAEQYDE